MNNEEFKSITQQLQEGVDRFENSEEYRKYLRVMAHFPTYSTNNTLLIYSQKPEATYVAGYQTWSRVFERNVRKGEKGIRIYAPVMGKYDDGETEKPVILRYRPIYVFDVSQTDGKPLPMMHKVLTQDVEHFELMRKSFEQISPVPVVYEPMNGSAYGCYSPSRKQIVLANNLPQLQTIKTLVHELTHVLLKHDSRAIDRNTMEVEAESTAYTVLQYFGLDTSEYSFPYIASWSKNHNLDEIRSSLTGIGCVSAYLISTVEKKLRDYAESTSISPEAVPEQLPQTSAHSQTIPVQTSSASETENQR